MTDAELMGFLKKGESEAFDELHARYSKQLLGYFIRMLNYNKAKAQDALHDLFLKVVEKPEMFDGSKKFRSWIYTVAHNICRNLYKHDQIVREAMDNFKMTESGFDENFFAKAAAKMDASVFKETLKNILYDLPAEKKASFILRYQEDHSIAEIAEIMNCEQGTVKSRIHYTLKILSEKLKEFNPQN